MKDNIYIIGLGHRARNGKDSVAQFIYDYIKTNLKNDETYQYDCSIIHFADALYEECRNECKLNDDIIKHGKLIYRRKDYFFKDFNNRYIRIMRDDISEEFETWLDIHLRLESNLEYIGMASKDPVLLQWWGTEYRRKMFGENYWVDRVKEKIWQIKNEIIYSDKFNIDTHFILIPDTRFKNELNFIQAERGEYIRVVRLNEDGSQYLDSSRNPNHQSENDLEGISGGLNIFVKSGEMELLKQKSIEAINTIIKYLKTTVKK